MGRRSNSDNAIIGLVYLIGLPFILIWWLLCGICWLIGKIILFFTSHKKPKLNKNIGITTANCPYCGIDLPKFPRRKTKCKNCGNYIYIRTRPADEVRILIKEDEIETIETEYDKKYGRTRIPIIDVSDEANKIIVYLTKNYQNFCNYPQILQINEADRLEILSHIWGAWDLHLSEKDFKTKFSKYDSYLLNQIYLVESGRFGAYLQKEEIKENNCHKKLIEINDFNTYEYNKYCLWKDIINVSEYYILQTTKNPEEDIHRIPVPNFIPKPGGYFKEELDYAYIWIDNKFVKLNEKEIERFCYENKIKY